jgi:hypothetical protein
MTIVGIHVLALRWVISQCYGTARITAARGLRSDNYITPSTMNTSPHCEAR